MTLLRNYIFLTLSVLLATLNTTSYAKQEKSLQKTAEENIKPLLIDPESANFQKLREVVNSKGEESICGEVNARNRYGGYTGFKKFYISQYKSDIVSPNSNATVSDYNLTGCAGPEAELEIRLRDEAAFSCNVLWNLLENIVIHKEDQNAAIKASITATKGKAKENGIEMSDAQVQLIDAQYRKFLEQTLSNSIQVSAIQKDPNYQKSIFLPACTSNTHQILLKQLQE